MKEYKKSTIKELRKIMSDRGIGYMSGWTKGVLIKRLEEEDKKGVFTPDSQLNIFEIQLTSLKLEAKDLKEDNDVMAEKQKRALELNNTYAKQKAKNNKRLSDIEAQEKFIRAQKKSVEDALNPDW